MWDYKLYLSSFKTRRNTVIATMWTKNERRKIFIDKKEGNLIQEVEKTKENTSFTLIVDIDFLIDRFKRTDQRKKAIGYEHWKFTEFGLGFMYGILLQNMWLAKQNPSIFAERKIYHQVLLMKND